MDAPTKNPTLFEIIREYQDQLAQLNDADLPNEVVLDTIEAMQGTVEDKLRAVIAYALQIKADAATRKEHAKRMAESAKAMENRYDSLMMYAQIGVMNSGLKLPLVLPEFTVNLAKNPPSVDLLVQAVDVPQQFQRRTIVVEVPEGWSEDDVTDTVRQMEERGAVCNVSVEVDKRRLLDAMKADPEPHRGYARIAPTSYRLTVR